MSIWCVCLKIPMYFCQDKSKRVIKENLQEAPFFFTVKISGLCFVCTQFIQQDVSSPELQQTEKKGFERISACNRIQDVMVLYGGTSGTSKEAGSLARSPSLCICVRESVFKVGDKNASLTNQRLWYYYLLTSGLFVI